MSRNKIKEIREKNNLTQKDLGEKLGISTRAMISLEKRESLVNRHVRLVSEATGASEWEVLGYDLPEEMEAALRDYRSYREESQRQIKALTEEYERRLAESAREIALLQDVIKAKDESIASKNDIIAYLNKQLDAASKD